MLEKKEKRKKNTKKKNTLISRNHPWKKASLSKERGRESSSTYVARKNGIFFQFHSLNQIHENWKAVSKFTEGKLETKLTDHSSTDLNVSVANDSLKNYWKYFSREEVEIQSKVSTFPAINRCLAFHNLTIFLLLQQPNSNAKLLLPNFNSNPTSPFNYFLKHHRFLSFLRIGHLGIENYVFALRIPRDFLPLMKNSMMNWTDCWCFYLKKCGVE